MLINKTIGCTRYVYNHFLREWSGSYQETGKGLSYNTCSSRLTDLKKQADTLWLKEPN